MASSNTEGVSGSCFCGAVRFEARFPSIFCAQCHCSMCRRSQGAGFVTWFAVPYSQFELTLGKDQLRRHQSSEHGSRSFCGECGTTLFCENSAKPDEIDIVLASVAGKLDRPPQLHVYFSDRAEWIEVADDLPRLGGKTGMEPLE